MQIIITIYLVVTCLLLIFLMNISKSFMISPEDSFDFFCKPILFSFFWPVTLPIFLISLVLEILEENKKEDN